MKNYLNPANWFKSGKPSEVKSCNSNIINQRAIWGDTLLGYGCGQKYSWSWLSSYMAWTYYMSVSPVANATDLIMESFASSVKIDPRIPETKVLTLFRKPNSDQTETELKEGQGKSYDVTGNMYTSVSALTEDSEPVDIYYHNPSHVTPVPDGMGGVSSYIVNDGGLIETYYRFNKPDECRYYTKDYSKELNHMKRFNPSSSSGSSSRSTVGMSSYNALFYEIEQFIEGSKHNWSVLGNGARPSAAVTTDPREGYDLTDEQFLRLESRIREKLQGSENAGNVVLLDGGKDIKMLSINNKDLDFIEGLKLTKEQVYRNRKIPVALIDASPKFSNLQEAKAQLFDMVVFPFADRYYEEMTRFLMPR
jgi:HK97 family phage portal protein